jgi:hypothetical protein
MKLNGETKAQMEWAHELKEKGAVSLLNPPHYQQEIGVEDLKDTSKDQPWEYDMSPKGLCADRYVLCTTVFWGLKFIPCLPVMILLCLPPVVFARIYISLVPDETDRLRRNLAFYVFWNFAWISFVPGMLVALISLIYDYILYYFFGLIYATIHWRWADVCKGQRKIDPFRHGPSFLMKTPDIFACVMGQSMRHGPGETTFSLAMMFLLMPWLKYYICCNPYIYNLDQRLVQQISTKMDDLGDAKAVARTARRIISQARQDDHKLIALTGGVSYHTTHIHLPIGAGALGCKQEG